MEILRFKLGGKNAFFKKPEVNSYVYFTFGNIHKVALLGIFGAILGYSGYTQQKGLKKEKKSKELTKSFPQFYERLKDIKISIIPIYPKALISKKIQTFNNSVGYASQENGGNLIVKEQYLENPQWEICVLVDSEEAKKIKDAICNRKCIYYPYLGRNDHFADVKDVRVEQIEENTDKTNQLSCLFPDEIASVVDLDSEDREELGIFEVFKYQEALPYRMDEWTNQYILNKFIYTNSLLENFQDTVYELEDGKKIVFY